MSNTSSTGGYLPLSPGQGRYEIEDVLHDMIAGITGLAGDHIRPRWQPDPPVVPEPDIDWCAFGISQFVPHNLPVIIHHGEGDGHSEMLDVEDLQVLVSFFGPMHMVLARHLRRGLYVPQNREQIRKAGMAFVAAGAIVPLPEQVALGWRPRADIALSFRLETRSTIPILNLKKMQGRIIPDALPASVETGCNACTRACWRVTGE